VRSRSLLSVENPHNFQQAACDWFRHIFFRDEGGTGPFEPSENRETQRRSDYRYHKTDIYTALTPLTTPRTDNATQQTCISANAWTLLLKDDCEFTEMFVIIYYTILLLTLFFKYGRLSLSIAAQQMSKMQSLTNWYYNSMRHASVSSLYLRQQRLTSAPIAIASPLHQFSVLAMHSSPLKIGLKAWSDYRFPTELSQPVQLAS